MAMVARPRRIADALVVATVCAIVGWCGPVPPAVAATATGSITGTVWRDLDSDGRRDIGEPGVGGVGVGIAGTRTRTLTDDAGRYELELPAGRRVVTVFTGWLASQCPGDLWCPAGRGPDQDFRVENQFLRSTVDVPADGTVADVDAGVLPDHGDPEAAGSALAGNDGGDGPASAADLAVRHSNAGDAFSACDDAGRTRVCRPGDSFGTNLQLYNQGTASASDVAFVLTVPSGTRLDQTPTPNPAAPGPTPLPTGRSDTAGDGSRWVEYRLPGDVGPASARWFRLTWTVVGGPTSPVPYRTGKERDHQAYAGISAATFAGDLADRDSVVGLDPRIRPDRGHNVNWPGATDDDATDGVGWNVGP